MMEEDKKNLRKKKKEARKRRRLERRAQRKERRMERKQARRKKRGKLKKKINEGLDQLFGREMEKIREERQQANAEHPDVMNPSQPLSKYVVKAAINAAKSGILPGFVGIVTIVPEITANVKNQLRLVYDVSLANGYEGDPPKELILFVLLDSLGKRLTGMGLMQGNTLYIRIGQENTLGMVVKILAGYILSQLVRSLVCRLLPGLGSIALMAWAHRSIMKISTRADEIFKGDVQITNDLINENELSQEEENLEAEVDQREEDDPDMIKFFALIELKKVDGKVTENEQALFMEMLGNSDLEEDEKQEIIEAMDDEDAPDLDLSYFENDPEEAFALVTDLIAMAKADGEFHTKEAGYIFQVAGQLNISNSLVTALLET